MLKNLWNWTFWLSNEFQLVKLCPEATTTYIFRILVLQCNVPKWGNLRKKGPNMSMPNRDNWLLMERWCAFAVRSPQLLVQPIGATAPSAVQVGKKRQALFAFNAMFLFMASPWSWQEAFDMCENPSTSAQLKVWCLEFTNATGQDDHPRCDAFIEKSYDENKWRKDCLTIKNY